MAIKMTNSRRWLDRMLEIEDYGVIATGGPFVGISVECRKKNDTAASKPVVNKRSKPARRPKAD